VEQPSGCFRWPRFVKAARETYGAHGFHITVCILLQKTSRASAPVVYELAVFPVWQVQSPPMPAQLQRDINMSQTSPEDLKGKDQF